MAISVETKYRDRHGNRLDVVYDGPLTLKPEFRNIRDDWEDDHYQDRNVIGHRVVVSATRPQTFVLSDSDSTRELQSGETLLTTERNSRNSDITMRIG